MVFLLSSLSMSLSAIFTIKTSLQMHNTILTEIHNNDARDIKRIPHLSPLLYSISLGVI